MLLLLISIVLILFPAKIAEGFAIVETVSYAIAKSELKSNTNKEDDKYLKALLVSCIIIPSIYFGVPAEAIGATLVVTEIHCLLNSVMEKRKGTLKSIGYITIYSIAGFIYFFSFYKIKGLPIDLTYLVFLSIVGSLAASLMEYTGSNVTEIVIPIAAATTYVIFAIYAIHTTLIYLTEAFTISLILSILSMKMGVADESGLLSATLIGTLIIVFTDIRYFIILILFYIIGSAATKYMYKVKYELGVAEPAGGARGYTNVFSNSLPALFFAMNYGFYNIYAFKLAFVASIATALGDTMASEIGKTSDKVYLITNFKKVKPGVNGGVSIKGEVAAAIGCLIISIVSILMKVINIQSLLIVFLSSFIGVHVDSILGATLEEKGMLTNSGVNFLATLISGLLSIFAAINRL